MRRGPDGEGDLWLVSVPLRERPSARLTVAERAVAQLATEGLSNAEIATQRGVSVRTVANQVATILRKLKAPGRAHIATRIGALDD